MEAQHTLQWYRKRIGCFTGSRVGNLMVAGRKKDEMFGKTAMSYIYEVAAERDINPEILSSDILFQDYLDQTSITSKDMRWGTDQEPYARLRYEKETGRRIVEVGSCLHKTIPHFSSSPDGFFCGDGEKGCIEIKSPKIATFLSYKLNVHDGQSLKDTEPMYYWQCQSHMVCTEAEWCDFVAWCPFLSHPVHIARIELNSEDVQQLTDRIMAANALVDEILKEK